MSNQSRIGLAAVFLACGLSTGCSRLLNLGNPDALTPATADECQQFGTELEQAVAANNEARTAELIGLDGMFRRSTADFEGSAEYHAQLRKHAEEDARNDPFVPLLL